MKGRKEPSSQTCVEDCFVLVFLGLSHLRSSGMAMGQEEYKYICLSNAVLGSFLIVLCQELWEQGRTNMSHFPL